MFASTIEMSRQPSVKISRLDEPGPGWWLTFVVSSYFYRYGRKC